MGLSVNVIERINSMSECVHKNTKVINSRPPAALNVRGSNYYASIGLSSIVNRRRECSDCGARFYTVEVPVDTVRVANSILNASRV